jgi:hypothetical protein
MRPTVQPLKKGCSSSQWAREVGQVAEERLRQLVGQPLPVARRSICVEIYELID